MQLAVETIIANVFVAGRSQAESWRRSQRNDSDEVALDGGLLKLKVNKCFLSVTPMIYKYSCNVHYCHDYALGARNRADLSPEASLLFNSESRLEKK